MVKRSIQTSKPGFTVGIEYDHLAIRVARLAADGRGGFIVNRLEELKGDYSEDQGLLNGLGQIKSMMGINSREPVVTCLTGKQIFATQLPFRKLAKEEMEQALRLELRKTVHFEVATSTLDYEIVSEADLAHSDTVQVLVALAANSLLKRQLFLLEKVGLKADAVDLLPIAIANALGTWKLGDEVHHPLIALHVGPQISTIVIGGEDYPFFNRNIYFAAEDIYGPKAMATDGEKRLQALVDEVARSLTFYEKNYGFSGFEELILLGDYLDGDSLIKQLQRVTGLRTVIMDLASKLGFAGASKPGRFDLALALAMRGEQ
jgi:Tfp pilus assembly PilM family ATPase